MYLFCIDLVILQTSYIVYGSLRLTED